MTKFSSPFLAKSPLNQEESYEKKSKRVFPRFNVETDTVISGRSNPYGRSLPQKIANENFHTAIRQGKVGGIKDSAHTKDSKGNYNYHMLIRKK